MPVKATLTIDSIPGLKPEDFRAAGRKALRAVGRQWITTYLPIHFTNAAYGRYGYTPRKPGVDFKKRTRQSNGKTRAIGEVKPLVWSGTSRNLAKTARMELTNDGSMTSAAGDVIIPAPALNFKNPTSRIDMGEEVRTITQGEINQLAITLVEVMDRELERLGKRARKTLAA